MTFTVSAWLVWLVAAFALAGAYAVWTVLAAWALSVVEWWRDRMEPLAEDADGMPWCEECGGWHRWSHEDYPDLPPPMNSLSEDGSWVVDGPLPPLPPERSREELGFTGEHPAITLDRGIRAEYLAECALDAHRERRPPWWEVQQRAAYESLGLDYPSGLLARVREAGR